MLFHVHMFSNDALLSASYRSASWKMEVMTKHIIGKAIICSTNHFTMTIWAVFQQCNFLISLSIHISLSLIPAHHTKWVKVLMKYGQQM